MHVPTSYVMVDPDKALDPLATDTNARMENNLTKLMRDIAVTS
jgi:hypothetical protein